MDLRAPHRRALFAACDGGFKRHDWRSGDYWSPAQLGLTPADAERIDPGYGELTGHSHEALLDPFYLDPLWDLTNERTDQ